MEENRGERKEAEGRVEGEREEAKGGTKMKEGGRERNVIWRGIEGEDERERRLIMEEMVEKLLGREVKIGKVVERKGEGVNWVLIVEMGRKDDKREKCWEARRRWAVGIDEDLTMEKRRIRWRMMEKARMERVRGKEVKVTNRKIMIDGVEWVWYMEEQNVVR